MKLTMNDKEVVPFVKAVFLDGNHMPTTVAFDTVEGWVEVAVPKVDNAKVVTMETKVQVNDDDVGQHELEWEHKKLYGTVEVMWHDDTPTQYKVAGSVPA
jgi:Zn ribbon nucleic-acid-binding protein